MTLEIPLIYLKEKQAFRKEGPVLRLLGSPTELAKRLRKDGFKLIHIVDLDALAGLATNTDIYNSLTYMMNVEVECAPLDNLVKKLLSLKCRVVLVPSGLDLSSLREKRLLVAKVSDEKADVAQFHDVVVQDADEKKVKAFTRLGKRVIIYDEDREKVKGEVWGIIVASF